MSSSDDDVPLRRGNRSNGANGSSVSKSHISESVDQALDQAIPSGKEVLPAISLRNGVVDEMELDVDSPRGLKSNGHGKRKGMTNGSANKNASSDDDDDKPLKRRRTVPSTAGKYKEDNSSDSDDEPLRTRSRVASSTMANRKPPKVTAADVHALPNSNTPLDLKLIKEKAAIEKRAEKATPSSTSRNGAPPKKKKIKTLEESDSDEPIAKSKRSSGSKFTAPEKRKSLNGVKKVETDDDTPLKRKTATKAAKPRAGSTTGAKKGAKGRVKKEETPEEDEGVEEEEEEYKWWEDPNKGDETKKWTTLEHAGVVFPPTYEPLPANVKMRYDGVPITLHPEAEEVAGFFGSMLTSTVNMENPTFVKNFFADFTEIVQKTGGAKDRDGNKIKLKDLKKCDFNPIFDHYEGKKAEKKALSAAEKKALKAEKDAAEAPYMYCVWDGRKEKVGNFRVEPPSLFRGRGEHPKTGHVKKRVLPEQITINIGKEAKVPVPPPGHKWKEVKHDNTGTWLAMWQENINGAYKYVMLAANSAIKGQSDHKKFEKARELKKHIARIRRDYKKDLKAELTADRQKATAMYLIDQLALRAGNEKGDDEAETVGCCSLKFEHITLSPPNKVIFDFLGKDSIRFYNEVEVDPQVFKNLKIFKKPPKCDGDQIFDRLSTTQLNKHLSNYMPGLSAKVFRTYNASFTMSNLLKDMKSKGSVQEKVKDYNDANREVAILCNHKRTVGAAHDTQMEKMTDRINGLRYQKWRIKQMMIAIDPRIKKRKGAEYFQLDPDISSDWVQQHQTFLVEEQRQKIEKKFQKENEKLAADGQKELKAQELKERLAVVVELASKFKRENKSKKVEVEGKGATIEKMEQNLEKLDQRIETMKLQAADKEENKEVALGTSKINYIDPRLTVVFSKKFNVPIERFFSKTLREKFDWAIKSVDENWEF